VRKHRSNDRQATTTTCSRSARRVRLEIDLRTVRARLRALGSLPRDDAAIGKARARLAALEAAARLNQAQSAPRH
jgi:hypothetical protein